MGTIFALLILALCLIIYFAPALNAFSRKHPNSDAILVLNFLAGWSIVGWIVAIVWSSTRIPEEPKPEPLDLGPGRFRVCGVDRETGFDALEYVDADSEANAKAKVELRGVVVTSVTRERFATSASAGVRRPSPAPARRGLQAREQHG